MSVELLEVPIRRWRCPSCTVVDQTQQATSHTRMHACAGLAGLTAPMVEVRESDTKVDARHLVVSREDYGGDGSPMAVETQHGDGHTDRTVFAPTARLSLSDLNAGGGARAGAGVARVAAEMLGQHTWADPRLEQAARNAEGRGIMNAWTASGVFARTVFSQISGGHAFNWSTDALKVALYNNSITPDKTVATDVLTEYNGAASQWLTANEVFQAGQWAQGGVALSGVTVAQASNVVTFTGSNTASGAAATLANVFGVLVYDTTVSSIGLCFNYLGGVNSVTGGVFTVVWNASGIATFTS